MQERERKAIQLSVTQVVVGALASVSAAVVGSTFGVTGTLLGAAVTSVVSTIGGALYLHSLEQARTRIRRYRNPRTGAVEAVEQRPPVVPPVPRRLPWVPIVGTAGLVFALSLGLLTAVEVAANQPMAQVVGDKTPTQAGTPAGTTVGALVQEVAEVAEPVSPVPVASPAVPTASDQPTRSATPESTPTMVGPGAVPARTAAAVPTATAPRSQPASVKERPTSTATASVPAKATPSTVATSAAPVGPMPQAQLPSPECPE